MTTPSRVPTGVLGLDEVLDGGLTPNRLYLIEGAPGSGKTTLALRFLLEGQRLGEPGLYITLSETTEELHAVAASHGWDLGGIALFELVAAEAALGQERETTLLHPWEIELGETVGLITAEVQRTGAMRVVFDSLSEMRLLAQDGLRFRRQVLALKQFFAQRGVTVLLVDDMAGSSGVPDRQLHSLCHGVITLERRTLDYGGTRRRLEVAKMRGARYREGWHDYVIRRGGLEIFPRLVAAEHHAAFLGEVVPSGVEELDQLLGGGPLRGTCLLLSGPAGSGKSTLAMQWVHAAALRGERCAIYQFDERAGTLLTRLARLGLDMEAHIADGRVTLRQFDPVEVSPGEFTSMLRADAATDGVRVVVIDSLSGYLAAMPEENQVLLQLHELLSFLNQRGVLTLLTNPQSGLLGSMQSHIDVSYLSDAILLLRFFEAGGRVRKAVSVIKNRGGPHEDSIRELRISADGLQVGETLTSFHGVLSGTPTYSGQVAPLLSERSATDG
ncbi:ATPase domain-containing protein [Falsiroseomonas tokyonensis]|uniref:non-specific serine/threonine protein kinase n=1 Tax=Falsiroseomonas tokyonensis TaxID=430521 RepID=A0ABV7BRE2_9PROT|nr:ATPase domain-containing protein [Falsiroseomonas tokyonensis]MBU8536633.1 AAA family ATPase [Falsiroseomonas tokyonensis]